MNTKQKQSETAAAAPESPRNSYWTPERIQKCIDDTNSIGAAAPNTGYPRKSRMTLELEQAYAEGKAARLRDHDGAATSVNVVNPYTNAAFAFAWNQGYSDQDTQIGETAAQLRIDDRKRAAAKPAHTPGPWRWHHSGNGRSTWTIEPGVACATSEADARLIAAAPTMLAALKDILADCDNALHIRSTANLDFAVEQSANYARAAIAATEGSNQ